MSDTPDADVVSPDTRRDRRIPPGQYLTRKWPVLHAGPTPGFDPAAWDFYAMPYGDFPGRRWTYDEFFALPRVKVFADMHCVTTWSMLDNVWEGVATRELLNHITVPAGAKYVMVHAEYGFTTNLPVDDFFGEDCLFAMKRNGEDLDAEHGRPLRLIVPRLYAWKSAKWVRAIEFMDKDRAGFWESWESGGYHMRGDPWKEERFR